jgi:hypothetical protein
MTFLLVDKFDEVGCLPTGIINRNTINCTVMYIAMKVYSSFEDMLQSSV